MMGDNYQYFCIVSTCRYLEKQNTLLQMIVLMNVPLLLMSQQHGNWFRKIQFKKDMSVVSYISFHLSKVSSLVPALGQHFLCVVCCLVFFVCLFVCLGFVDFIGEAVFSLVGGFSCFFLGGSHEVFLCLVLILVCLWLGVFCCWFVCLFFL